MNAPPATQPLVNDDLKFNQARDAQSSLQCAKVSIIWRLVALVVAATSPPTSDLPFQQVVPPSGCSDGILSGDKGLSREVPF
jgi:hypothetical protein